MKHYGAGNEDGVNTSYNDRNSIIDDRINYKMMSITLGLHKDSYNYLGKV